MNYAVLTSVDAQRAYFTGAVFRAASLIGINCDGAVLNSVEIINSRMTQASCRGATFLGANLSGTALDKTDFSGAILSGANLSSTTLAGVNLSNATLDGARVYGTSVWDVNLDGASQSQLIITDTDGPQISADSLEVAQFLHLLLTNSKLRTVIDTITSKVVLILGRFSPSRKLILDELRAALRVKNYLPVLFDFEKPANRDVTETVSTLAHLSRFVIADITEPRSIPQELQAIVPALQSVPVAPILFGGEQEYGMFSSLQRRPNVLTPFHYDSNQHLIMSLEVTCTHFSPRRSLNL